MERPAYEWLRGRRPAGTMVLRRPVLRGAPDSSRAPGVRTSIVRMVLGLIELALVLTVLGLLGTVGWSLWRALRPGARYRCAYLNTEESS